MTRRAAASIIVFAIILGACSGDSISAEGIEELALTDPAAMSAILQATEVPVVLNVWASWCGPCRSEAPLLRQAHAEYGAAIEFIGIDVRDSQAGARAFIAEFGLDGFTHYFDASGAVPAALGGFGVPLTFFFAPGGELSHLHSGVIDERTLALQIDELLQR